MTKARIWRAFLFVHDRARCVSLDRRCFTSQSCRRHPNITPGNIMAKKYSSFQPRAFALPIILGLAFSPSPGISIPLFPQYSTVTETRRDMACEPCAAFNGLNSLVRDGKIARAEARNELSRLLPAIKACYYRHGGEDFNRSEWVFPLAGYTVRAIDGGRGHGYDPRGYDWFDGNRHKGHPALDIFIRDRDQDERDDQTGRPVPVLSLSGGIVIALETSWEPGSGLRGGKYLWIYDPATETLVYYAHNRELMVRIGTIVKPGDRIATVGRTGFNAHKKRSPTHLHLTLLRIANGSLTPEDPYPILRRCRTK